MDIPISSPPILITCPHPAFFTTASFLSNTNSNKGRGKPIGYPLNCRRSPPAINYIPLPLRSVVTAHCVTSQQMEAVPQVNPFLRIGN